MPEKRKTRASGSRAGAQRTATQTTLKDLFQRANSGADSYTEKPQDLDVWCTLPVPPTSQAMDTRTVVQRSKPSRLYPIFAKASSARERVLDRSVDDIDVIDISYGWSMEPSLSFTSPLTPRSDFSRVPSRPLSPSPVVLNDQCHEVDTGPLHAKGTHSHRPTVINDSGKRKLESRDVVPFPSSCSQHVRGVQHPYTCGQAPSKRSVLPSSRVEGGLDFLKNLWKFDDTPGTPPLRVCRSLTPQQCKEYLDSIGRDYTDLHPAIARVSTRQEETPLRHAEMWTRRFRPRRASEVLGNEQHALYLREWLRALQLRSQDHPPGESCREKKNSKRAPRRLKRPRVVRAVTQKRGHKRRRMDSDDDLNDFVVWSDTDEQDLDDPMENSEDDFTFCQRTLDRLRGRETADTDEAHGDGLNGPATATDHVVPQLREAVHANFAEHLTNTLLISGPPGCGKTAAVYACAEELGWEIFEVHPGVGRRNGAGLEQLVGDVGRNHIVRRVQRGEGARTKEKERVGLDGYVTRGQTRELQTGTIGTKGEPISVEIDGPPLAVEGEVGAAESGGGRVRQSLVLLEEVDILFKEDGGFWPAVIEMIRCCQRPVVMTCNDVGLVPVRELPMQTVLVFEPCPSEVAASFLQCLSLTEGCHVPHEDLVGLYESTRCIDGPDVVDGLVYGRSGGMPMPDLRRSVMELEMACAGGPRAERERGEGEDRRSGRAISAERMARSEMEVWQEMKRESEVMSHVDAQQSRSGKSMVEDKVAEEGEEMGYVVLDREEVPSRGAHEWSGAGPMEASIKEAFRARVAYETRIVEGMKEIFSGRCERSVFLDYIPWIRFMVAVDEGERRGRRTRNSMGVRSGAVRGRGEVVGW